MQWKAVMHSRLKLIVPLGLLFSFGCIDVPPVDAPPVTTPETDGGNTQNPPDGGNNQTPPDGGSNQEPQADFTLSVSPTRVSVLQGKGQTLQLSVTREGGFSGSVSVSAVNPPAGITVLPATIPAGSTSADLTVSVAESAEPGAKVLTLKGTAGELSHEAAFELTVVRLGDLLVGWTSPSQDTVYVNGSLPLQVSVEGGTADYVELLKGETVLTRLTAAPYQFTWDTTQTAEQTYTLTARAVRGASTFTTNGAKTVVVDRTAPTVVSRTPAPGASNVSVKATLEVSFSEALKLATVKDASVLVSAGGSNVAKTFSTSADGKTLKVTPTAPLPLESTVSLTLGTATEPLTDLAGNAVAAATPWTFTVPTWLPMGGAISAQAGNTPAENVTMKVGADGVPVIAWSEFDGSTSARSVYVRRWTGSQWIPMGAVLNAVAEAGTNAINPSLVLDGENRPIVVWDEWGSSTSNLYGSRWNGNAWNALPDFPSIPADDTGRQRPSLAIDTLGNITVASEFLTIVGLRQSAFTLLAGQSGWVDVSPQRPEGVWRVSSPSVAVNASRNVFLVSACNLDSGEWGVVVQKFEAGIGWPVMGDVLVTRAADKGSLEPAVVSDGAENPIVVWSETASQSHTAEDIRAARWNGSSWELLGQVVSENSTSNSKPSVLMGGDGQPLVAWSGVSSSERSIRVSQWSGSAWQPVGAPLSAVSGGTAAFNPVLALDRKNNRALVAWHESDGTASNIYVYQYNN